MNAPQNPSHEKDIMKQVTARQNYLLLYDDGWIHYPYSKFLTDEFNNPNTRELSSQSLRIFQRFCEAYKIDIAVRALEGRCLTYDECTKLADLCYRPLGEVETFSNKKVAKLTCAKAGKAPKDLPNAVEHNTAKTRLNHIAHFLTFYLEVFLCPHIQSKILLTNIQSEFSKTTKQLQRTIRGTKQGHHLQIKSLPSTIFLQIIRTIFLQPETLFLNESGKPSRTLKRDRAMALLACEGLRPGTIGNIARSDFSAESKYLVIKDHRGKRDITTSSTPVVKLGASTQVNSATEGIIKLWPFTCEVILEYIHEERDAVLSKHLKNQSKGFLFLNEKGEPVRHRSTITKMFKNLGLKLSELGLLTVGDDPYFRNRKEYDFYAYVLRHSAASLFLEMHGTETNKLDKMKLRFGWTMQSMQPQRYAARAMSDQANLDMVEFSTNLLYEARERRNKESKP